MNDELVEFISNINSTEYDEFIKNAKKNSSLVINEQLKDYDYSWINKLEEYLPFISNIVNLDYTDSFSNTVLKSYENRFIKSLLFRLKNFIQEEQNKIKKLSLSNTKGYISRLETVINNEIINVEIRVTSNQTEESKKIEVYGLSLEERLNRLISIIDTLLESNFIKSLSDLSIISGDIVKTEVLEQELNYRKAYELYECINNYVNSVEVLDINKAKNNIEQELSVPSFLGYQLFKNCTNVKGKNNSYKEFLERLIEKMVLETSMDEKSFKKMLTKKFEEEYEKKKNREKNIQNIFTKSIENYNKQVKDATRALKS